MHVELRIAENAGKVNIEMYVAYEGKYLNVAYMKNTYLCTFHYLLFSAFRCESLVFQRCIASFQGCYRPPDDFSRNRISPPRHEQ